GSILYVTCPFHSREGRRTTILSVSPSPALVSGLMVVRAKNPVHPVPSSIPVFRNTSGSPILLGPDLPAMISPVVHTGAIAVLSLPVVMMLNIQIAEIHEKVSRYPPVSGIIGLIPWWEMSLIPDNDHIPLLPTSISTNSLRYTVHAGEIQGWTNSETSGNSLHTYYSVRFLVSSLILSVAMIGATVLTMHRTTRVKRQDVFRQNAIDSKRTMMRRTTDPHLPTPGSAPTIYRPQ
ncbi:NADH-ubiquinone oxidoreductase chain 6-like, partial [Cryptomeria japonica]